MANNRSGISHPALNAAGGSALWTSIDNIYQLFSDQDVGRWVDFTALANSAKVTVTHSFGVSFDDLKVVVYTGTYPNLTQVQNFTVAATTGFEKTKIDVTAPASGGPFSGYVLVVHNAAMQQRVVTTTQRLALTPYVSMLVYDSDLKSLMVWNGTTWTPAGGGATLKSTITQASHGFTSADIGTPLYLLGANYTKAFASASDMAEVAGLLESVIDANTFSLALCGDVTIAAAVRNNANLANGTTYFLSGSVPGRITSAEPTIVGYVSKPIGIAKDLTTLSFFNMRGSVVGSSNVRTQISIANNATTTIQDVSAYEAGELTGWVSVAATTPLKFYVAAQFSKNGAGNNYNISYQTSGDAPPAGFLVQVTAAGLVQIVMPSVTGFASASINYALNAPAVGATLPLSISARSVLGDTSGTAVPVGYVGERISGTIATGTSVRGVIGNVSSITLTPGTYLIFRKLNVGTSGQDGTTNINLNAEIVAGSNSTLPGGETYSNFDYSNYSIGQQGPRWLMGGSYYNVTSAGTYYFNARVNFSGTLTTATVGSESYFYAVRIA